MAVTDTSVFLSLVDGSLVAVDVTNYVLSVSVNLGKNRALDSFQPGTASVTLKNLNREFDPLNTSSSFYGLVLPKASFVVIKVKGTNVFAGYVDDWAFDYQISGESTASFAASEVSALFAQQNIFATSFPIEKSGDRVNRILADAGVNFVNPPAPALAPTTIYSGLTTLSADSSCFNTNVLDYLHYIETSEQGMFYFDTDNTFVFEDASNGPTSTFGSAPYLFADDGTTDAYPYSNINISYTSQLLYNSITTTSKDSTNSQTSADATSKSKYQTFQLNVDNVLYNDTSQLKRLADGLLAEYLNPEYRFESLTVNYSSLSDTLRSRIVTNIGLNGWAKIKYTPNKSGSVIERYVKVIGIQHDISVNSHNITFSFQSLRNAKLVLDDPEFGKLDLYALGL